MWSKLKVGDTVYVKYNGGIFESKIVKAGRKFLYIDYERDLKFLIDDKKDKLGNVSNYNSSYYIYTSREQIELEVEQLKLENKVRTFLRDSMFKKMDINILRKLSALIDELG